MAKLTTSDISSLNSSAVTTINNNFALVETAMENTLSRDGTSPNSMSADLDMNSNNIINLPAAASSTEPVRKAEFDANNVTLEATVSTYANNASASAAAAAVSALEAESHADRAQNEAEPGTSTTSVLVGTGSKTFTTQASKPFEAGRWLLIHRTSAPTTYMHGQSTSYTSTTLQVNITNFAGSGTHSDWTITVSGTQGVDGDVSGPVTTVDGEIALWDGTTGEVLKSATNTGILKATSGVLATATEGTDYLAVGATSVEFIEDTVGALIDSTTSIVAAYADATPSITLERAALTGDITSAQNSNATTLATVNANVGTFGSATATPQITVNAKGLTTAAADVTITPAVGSITGLGAGVSTFLATPSSANLISAVTDETGTGALVFATSPTLVTPALGTPSALVLTNATGLPTAGIVDDAVTFAKIQNITTDRLLGRDTAASGDTEEISLNATLEFTGSASIQRAALTGDVTSAAGSNSVVVDKASEDFAFTGDISPAQITADQNDYNPTGLSTATVLRLSTDAARNITGLAGGADGRILVLLNIGAFDFVLVDESASSSAANRFAFDANATVAGDQSIIIIYDSTSSRWRKAGGSGGGGGGGAPTTSQYVTLATDGTLTNERVLTAGNGIALTDAGAGSTITVAADSASDTVDGVIEIAVQSEQETGSSTTLAVTPGRQHFHPSAAKAWVQFNSAGTVAASYNITSVTDSGTGGWTVNIATDFSSASYGVATSVENSTTRIMMLGTPTAGTIPILVEDSTFNAADATAMRVIAFGDL